MLLITHSWKENSWIHTFLYVKCKQPCPGFELLYQFLTMINITLQAPPYFFVYKTFKVFSGPLCVRVGGYLLCHIVSVLRQYWSIKLTHGCLNIWFFIYFPVLKIENSIYLECSSLNGYLIYVLVRSKHLKSNLFNA